MRTTRNSWPPGRGSATRQDSLNAYNAAVELLRALEQQGYELDEMRPYDVTKRELDEHHRRARGEYNEDEIMQYETFIKNMKEDPESYSFEPPSIPLKYVGQFDEDRYWPKGEYPTIDEYYGIFDNTTEGNVTRVREMTTGVMNPSLPTGYYDINIDPQGIIDATATAGMADYVELPFYDPLAVKPYDLLTEEEKKERREKYGPEKKYEPEKKSNRTPTPRRPRVVIPERLEPRGLTYETPERDIIRDVLKPSEYGRKPELIYKSSNRTRTDKEPNYYRVWDDKDKQWKMRPVEPEELDRYLRENKIVEPRVTPPISFNKGGKVVKYKNGGRPGGFLSSNARDGWPKAHKSYYPFSGRDVTVEDGVTTVENRQGYDSGMKEMLELIRMGSGGSRRQISLPTGREYKDTDLMRTTTRYAGDDFIDQKSARYKLHKDDKAKTFDQYKGVKTPKGSKSVEIQGEDLNWLQRNFPRLFLERYKTKSKYNDEGELVKKVKVSRAGGREVKKYPTSAELDAIIEQDIKAAQAQDNTNASGGRVVKYKHGGRHDDPPNYSLGKQVLDYLAGYGQARPQENNRFDPTLQDMADFFMSRQGQELGTEPQRRYVSGEGVVPVGSEREEFEDMLDRTMVTNDKFDALYHSRVNDAFFQPLAQDPEYRSFMSPGAVDKETGERLTRREYLRRQEEGNEMNTTLDAPIVYNYLSENPSARGMSAEEFYHAVQAASSRAKNRLGDMTLGIGTSEAIGELMDMNFYSAPSADGLLGDGTTFDTPNLYQANEPRDNSDKGFYDGVHYQNIGDDGRSGMSSYYLSEDQAEGDAALNAGIYFAREMGVLPEGEITAQDLPEILERFKGYTATQPGRTEFDPEKLKGWKPDGRKIVKVGKDGKVTLTKYGQKWMQDDDNKRRFRERTMTQGESREARLDNSYMRMLEDIITDAANQQGMFDPTKMNPSIAREGYKQDLNSPYIKDYERRSANHPANRLSSNKMPIDLLLDVLNTGGGYTKSYRERSDEMDSLRRGSQ